MKDSWTELQGRLDTLLSCLQWGSFVILEYDKPTIGDLSPYCQAAPGPRGWYVEVVSQAYLDSGSHPLNEDWLVQWGFHPPDDETENWWRDGVPGDQVAQVLLDGLRHGCGCANPALVEARTGTFPPRPDGGEPAPILADDLAMSA